MARTSTHLMTDFTWGTRRPEKSECLIEVCSIEADCEVTVESDGLRSRYAACSEHGYDIGWGTLAASPTPLNRGFIASD